MASGGPLAGDSLGLICCLVWFLGPVGARFWSRVRPQNFLEVVRGLGPRLSLGRSHSLSFSIARRLRLFVSSAFLNFGRLGV